MTGLGVGHYFISDKVSGRGDLSRNLKKWEMGPAEALGGKQPSAE